MMFNPNMMNPNMANNPMDIQNKFNQFVQNFRQGNQDPRQKIQELLDSGKMSQQQYNQLRQMANKFLGTNY